MLMVVLSLVGRGVVILFVSRLPRVGWKCEDSGDNQLVQHFV